MTEPSSLMVFIGGPKDGEETEPHDGFPAPGGGSWPDLERADLMHDYTRRFTVEQGGTVRHIYQYDGPRER